MKETIKKINDKKIIAIVRGINLKDIIPTAQALLDGGVELIEVTFNQSSKTGEKDTCDAIKMLCDHFGENVCVGAGTVISAKQAELAINAGAKYIISPNTSIDVINKTKQMGAVSIPGALTPTEVTFAYDAGADYVKLFPAGNFGIGYIKAVRAPLSHIPVLAVGGVSDENLLDFFNAGVSGVGVGSNIVNCKLIGEGKFSELTKLAKKYTDQL
jgi:2-dehydro-3-deoxyphosphogluconate aldolase / (4S)-4-hydroxy-2-oxoglutarate aldolase